MQSSYSTFYQCNLYSCKLWLSTYINGYFCVSVCRDNYSKTTVGTPKSKVCLRPSWHGAQLGHPFKIFFEPKAKLINSIWRHCNTKYGLAGVKKSFRNPTTNACKIQKSSLIDFLADLYML